MKVTINKRSKLTSKSLRISNEKKYKIASFIFGENVSFIVDFIYDQYEEQLYNKMYVIYRSNVPSFIEPNNIRC